jgi:hypothetical protein
MKCWKSAFNAQGSRVIVLVLNVRAVKILYINSLRLSVTQQWRRSGKGREGMKLSLQPKLVGKPVCVPVISFCKIFIPSYAFDALLCRNWPFSPPNHLTSLQITLLREVKYFHFTFHLWRMLKSEYNFKNNP